MISISTRHNIEKEAGIELSKNGIGVTTTARMAARAYYQSQGNELWAKARNDRINDLLASDFQGATPEHRYLLKSGDVAEVRRSNMFLYIAAMRRGSYDILLIPNSYSEPTDEKYRQHRLKDLDWVDEAKERQKRYPK